MMQPQTFNLLLAAMAVLAVVVFIALHFVNAGYGMMYAKKRGPSFGNRLGVVLMEAPVFVAMALLWAFSSRRTETAPLVIFLLFELHYFQRSFVFPMLLKGKNRMPLSIIAMGVVFNLINALMQGGWLFYLSSPERYAPSWLCSWQFILGTLAFFLGMGINLHSDNVIRHLRKPGDTRHYIPRRGMYRWVSSANYFGEFVEWCGFALLTWSWAGAVFALWTFANLAPRAGSIHQRYSKEFGEEFDRLKLKKIIPFIY